MTLCVFFFFFFSSRRRHTRCSRDWSSDVCSSDLAVNCSAFPEHLIESELFGHERGSFTDAHAAKPGLFEVADRGTLFLDEIGDLPLSLQAKLLRVLEDKQIRRVGGTKSRTVDVRILAATNEHLAQRVR